MCEKKGRQLREKGERQLKGVEKRWRQLKGDYMFICFYMFFYMFLNAEGNRKCEKKGRQLKV